jgi:prolyl-tRNA synthetase
VHKQFAIPFLFFKRPQHDKFKGAVNTFAADSIMPDGRAIQLPSTHFLGQNFAKAFGVKFVDKDKKEKYAWQTCYGPAVWRMVGALAAIHGDDKGLVLPPAIAPYQIVIVPIYYKEKEREIILSKCKKISDELKLRIFIDDRKENTPGWKFNYWELKGVPIRIEIGPKDLKKKQVVLVRRDDGKKIFVKEKQLAKSIKNILEEIQESMIKKADKYFKEHVSEANNLKELKELLDKKGGFVKAGWCGETSCADNIKAETNGGMIRGTLFDKKEKTNKNCVYCSRDAEEVVYFAKAY